MMGMMIGAVGAIASAERRRAYAEDAPVIYAPQPYDGVQLYDKGYVPQGRPIIISETLRKSDKVVSPVNTSAASLN